MRIRRNSSICMYLSLIDGLIEPLRSEMPIFIKKSEPGSSNRLFCRSCEVTCGNARLERWIRGAPFFVNRIVKVNSVDSTRQFAKPDSSIARASKLPKSIFVVFDFDPATVVICNKSLSRIFTGLSSTFSNSGCMLRRRPEKIARTSRSGLLIIC